MRFFLFILIIGLAAGGYWIFTTSRTISTNGVQPGDSLYSLDRWMEGVKTRFANTEREKAEIALENASERLRELVGAAEDNDTEGIETAGEGLSESLASAVEHAYRIAEPTVRETVTVATERLTEEAKPVLADVSERVEEKTQKALATVLKSLQDELDRVFDDIKERAKEEIRKEMAELGERLKTELREQLNAIGNNITGESSE